MNPQDPQPFGVTPDGKQAFLYTLESKTGMRMQVSDYGATITSLVIPSNNRELDVVLGFDRVEDYAKSIHLPAPPYFGAAVGRWSGRINKGIFSLNGQRIDLQPNNGGHLLHGGASGFSQRIWDVKNVGHENASITFSYLSPDGEENFPGEFYVEVTYMLTPDNELQVSYKGKSDKDTIVNMTQHSYFNLDGHNGSIAEQQMKINAKKVLETVDMIPTGRLLNASETPFDFSSAKSCPASIDASFVLEKGNPAAYLASKKTNLKMSVFTDQPSVHIYVGGNCFGEINGKNGAEYHPLSGICFETQNFPDAPNYPNFPDPVLRKGEKYTHNTKYKFETLE